MVRAGWKVLGFTVLLGLVAQPLRAEEPAPPRGVT